MVKQRFKLLKNISLILAAAFFENGCAPASVEHRLNYLEPAVFANDNKFCVYVSDDQKRLEIHPSGKCLEKPSETTNEIVQYTLPKEPQDSLF